MITSLGGLPGVTVITTSATGRELPATTIITHTAPTTDQIEAYLTARAISGSGQRGMSWPELVAHTDSALDLLAQPRLATRPEPGPAAPPDTTRPRPGNVVTGDVHGTVVQADQIHGGVHHHTNLVVTGLAELLVDWLGGAPLGPSAPIAFARGALRGHSWPLGDVLAQLGATVIRTDAGLPTERVGLRVAGATGARDDARWADLIAEVAPMDQHDPAKPEHSYAEVTEADHLWNAGRYEEAVNSVEARESVTPAVNRDRWAHWHAAATTRFGPEHPLTIRVAGRYGMWLGKSGDKAAALGVLDPLLPTALDVLGPEDPLAMAIRHNRAYWLAENGRAAEAIPQFSWLRDTCTRLHGPRHLSTLDAWLQLTIATAKDGEVTQALREFVILLAECEQHLGPWHQSTLSSLENLAFWTPESRTPPPESQQILRRLTEAELGLTDDNLDTITFRFHASHYRARIGLRGQAVAEFTALLVTAEHVLGPDHPHIAKIQEQIDRWA